MKQTKEEPKQVCENYKKEISEWGCACGKQELNIKELNRLDDIEIEEMSNDWETMSEQIEPKQLTDLEIAIKLEEIKREEVEKLADKWVFETNGYKWSNNDGTAGDNFGSFIAGFKACEEQNKNKYSEEEVLELIQFLAEREDFKENSSMSIFIAQDFLQKFKNK